MPHIFDASPTLSTISLRLITSLSMPSRSMTGILNWVSPVNIQGISVTPASTSPLTPAFVSSKALNSLALS
ncbi:hypothetical protein ACB092_02G093700 [Castanea dentata]